jgi:hypothetical protein
MSSRKEDLFIPANLNYLKGMAISFFAGVAIALLFSVFYFTENVFTAIKIGCPFIIVEYLIYYLWRIENDE